MYLYIYVDWAHTYIDTYYNRIHFALLICYNIYTFLYICVCIYFVLLLFFEGVSYAVLDSCITNSTCQEDPSRSSSII